MTSSEIKTAIRDYLQSVVPTAIADAGLTDFEQYLDETPYDAESRQLAVYLAEGNDDFANRREAFIVQGQLPGEMYPDPYHDIVWEALKSFDPESVGLRTRNATWQVWYPGESDEGGSTSFLIYEFALTGELDDCED